MSIADRLAIRTRTGLDLFVRPARASDEAALAQFFARVSDADRRFRFLSATGQPSHGQMLPLLAANHVTAESYLAFDRKTDELVASGLFARDEAGETAEVAIAVRADYRGQGVGWALLDLLAQAARAQGARRVISIESRDNHAAIDLERENGFTAEPCDGDPGLVLLARRFD